LNFEFYVRDCLFSALAHSPCRFTFLFVYLDFECVSL